MDAPRPEVGWGQSVESWRLGLRAMRAMPVLAGSAAGAAVGVALLSILLGFLPFPLGALLAAVVPIAANAAWSASLAIAVHRFVLRQEAADRPVWVLPPAFAGYFRWLLVVQLGFVLEQVFSILLTPLGTGAAALAGLLGFPINVATCVYALRLLLMFPALALDEPGASPEAARDASRGHRLRMFLLLALTALVGMAAVVLVVMGLGGAALALGAGAWGMVAMTIAPLVLPVVAGVVGVPAMASMMSLCWRAYGPSSPDVASPAPAAPIAAMAGLNDPEATVRIAPGALRRP